MSRASLIALLQLLLLLPMAHASQPPTAQDWRKDLGSIPVQDGGRVMPLDTYSRQLAVHLTGRTRWSAGKGPEGYSGKQPVELVADLLFKGATTWRAPLIAVENDAFRRTLGLEAGENARRFYTPMELMLNTRMQELMSGYEAARASNPEYQPSTDEKAMLELRTGMERAAALVMRRTLPIVPQGEHKHFLNAGPGVGDPGTENVQAALTRLGDAYAAAEGGQTAELTAAIAGLRSALSEAGSISAKEQRAVALESYMNRHNPWRVTAVAYGLAIVAFGLSCVFLRLPMRIIGGLLLAWGIVEHSVGTALRIIILDRAPVSNTYESLLWMGLVAIAVGGIFQYFNRKSYYFIGGLIAAELSVLFAMLVPLEQQTNSLPAVLRSNYWLILHVITIVTSYGVLAMASVLGHVYLFKEVILKRPATAGEAPADGRSPLVTQTYRTIQLGVLLLTAGTILGGVWAADSWGRFWGWDPKETWALVSIVIYFAMLHARYVGWLREVGMAAAAIVGFLAIVWTFYGVNYVMATGLHSYGFGSGGEKWVALWAIAEIGILGVAKWRHAKLASERRLVATPTPLPV